MTIGFFIFKYQKGFEISYKEINYNYLKFYVLCIYIKF